MKMGYKYPQRAFPYAKLVEENGRRGFNDEEYELIGTGIFAENAYLDSPYYSCRMTRGTGRSMEKAIDQNHPGKMIYSSLNILMETPEKDWGRAIKLDGPV